MTNPVLADYRFDPFTGADQSLLISGEAHTIPSSSPYYVQLDEVPRNDSPSSVAITGYTEVSGAPAAGQFQVDYMYKTGLVRFNSADAGKAISVTYYGTGHPNRVDYMNALKDGTGMDDNSILLRHMANDSIGQAEISASAVGQGELKSTTGSATGSLSPTTGVDITISGSWSFIYLIGCTGGSNSNIRVATRSTAADGIRLHNIDTTSSFNYDVRWRNINT